MPADDRFQFIHQHAQDELVYDADYLGLHRTDDLVIVDIIAGNGRDTAQKKALYGASGPAPAGTSRGRNLAARNGSGARLAEPDRMSAAQQAIVPQQRTRQGPGQHCSSPTGATAAMRGAGLDQAGTARTCVVAVEA